MIVITGAAGFIGSNWWAYALQQQLGEIIAVDDFGVERKKNNWANKTCRQQIDRNVFLDWLSKAENAKHITAIVHLGARTDTTEKRVAIFDQLNVQYSQAVFRLCARYQIPLVYASSAATYGAGEQGYDDNVLPTALHPLNPYGHSKNDFDRWALEQTDAPPFWAGLKFFNVYGANEYHKGRMASVVLHTFRQIAATGAMQLFRSHRADYKDGEQQRDFIYIKDLLHIIDFMLRARPANGLYNVGTGVARTFLALAESTFAALGKEPVISFVDTPLDIRDTYQYFTQATVQKLRLAGYERPFYTLEAGIEDYVRGYLREGGNF